MKNVIERMRHFFYNALRRSEKYTKTDMVYATKGGFWLTLERVLSILFGFAMSVAFANLMEPEKYGIYKYILSMMGIVGAFSLGGMTTAITQAVARGLEGALKEGFVTSLKWSIGSVIAAFCLSAYYFIQDNTVLGMGFLIAGSVAPLIASAALYDNFLAGGRRFTAKALYGTLRNGLPALILIGTLFFSQNPILLVGVYFISTALTTYFCYRDTVRRFTPNSKKESATLTYGKHLSLMNIIDTVGAQADRVLAFSQLGGTALAIYSFVELIPDQVRGMGSVIGTLALPKMSKTPLQELKRTLPRKALILFGVAAVATVLYILLVPYFFQIFFPAYMSAVPYTQWYGLSILGLPGILFNRALVGHMKKNELYIIKISTFVFRVVTLIILVSLFGMWGIITAALLYYAFTGMTLTYFFFSAKDTPTKEINESSILQ